ncbi:MAG: site-specific integrase [Candidatus Hydrogenedentes bacterium]|nr:site-specific integrase [Candidatus Hydrogenedentota bacterium]
MHAETSHLTPKLRLHKSTQQGYVVLNGRYIYLGRYDHPATAERYHRVIAEWIANHRQLPVEAEDISITEIVAQYWNHVVIYYVDPRGLPTSSRENIRRALKPVNALYGSARAVAFGPKSLRAVRQTWIDAGLARKTVNSYTAEVKRLFKWAASHELIPVTAYQALHTLDGLKRGRSEARETAPVLSVPPADIAAVLPNVSRQVQALIQLQILTGARSGELLTLRPLDFDTSGAVWLVRLAHHKTSYRGHDRILYFGPRAQRVLKEFLNDRPVHDFLFSPREAESERYTKSLTHRRPDQLPNVRRTSRVLGEVYTVNSYRRAVQYGCMKAKIPVWNPHRLRHNAATIVRREYGLEAAQLILGHARADVTQVYAEVNHVKAIEVAKSIG